MKQPENDYERYLATLPPSFKATAKSDLYRKGEGWIARGISERRIVVYYDGEAQRIAPVFDQNRATGIDSSSNIIAICCFDNYTSGYFYLEKILHLPKSRSNLEYHWNKLDRPHRRTLTENLETFLNISCKKMIVIDTNLINSGNRLTMNQFVGMLEGCFTGYENDPEQNADFRRALRDTVFNLVDNVPCHCDSDFQTIEPPDIVRVLVRTLSKRGGKIQPCTPLYTTLRSHESQPIQITDLIAGCIRSNLRPEGELPFSLRRLYFDGRHLSAIDKRSGLYVKAYHWGRSEV